MQLFIMQPSTGRRSLIPLSMETMQSGFTRQARRRWQELAEELQVDVAELNLRHGKVSFLQPAETEIRVSNPSSGVELALTADFAQRLVRYDYVADAAEPAGIPEGGILSMRERNDGSVEFYSADERLTPEETRSVLLEPLFSPPMAA